MNARRLFIAIILFTFLAGIADSCMDTRKDNYSTSTFSHIQAKWFKDWYAGGNDHYSLPIWGPFDFWHLSKSCLFLSWSMVTVLMFLSGEYASKARFWRLAQAAGLFALVYLLEAWTFILFYHFVWRL